eukprot:8559572-Pyramimonas_sp.AAC.1
MERSKCCHAHRLLVCSAVVGRGVSQHSVVSVDIATHKICGILSLSVHVFRIVRAVGLPRLVRFLSRGEGFSSRHPLM